MWKKLDMHVHTPASLCYLDYNSGKTPWTRPSDIVKAALDKGLEGIAITDHNSVAYIDKMIEEGEKQGLAIIPGIEISAKGGHLLAFFSYYQPPSFWEQFLFSVGLNRGAQGQGSFESDMWLDQVAYLVSEMEGLAIAAHIDRKLKGFFTSDEISFKEKKKILACPSFSGVEITISQDKKSWNDGTVPGLSLPLACIQGSDAHSIEEIGRRPIYMDIPNFNLGRLKQALEEFRTRIRFPHEMENQT